MQYTTLTILLVSRKAVHIFLPRSIQADFGSEIPQSPPEGTVGCWWLGGRIKTVCTGSEF